LLFSKKSPGLLGSFLERLGQDGGSKKPGRVNDERGVCARVPSMSRWQGFPQENQREKGRRTQERETRYYSSVEISAGGSTKIMNKSRPKGVPRGDVIRGQLSVRA